MNKYRKKLSELELLTNIAEIAEVDKRQVAMQYGEWYNLNPERAYIRTLKYIEFVSQGRKG